MKKYYLAMVGIFLLAAMAIGWNISVTKDPASDNRREADLGSIETAVQRYATKNNKLPASLSSVDLTSDIKGRVKEYDYKPGVGEKYQLCATFKTDTTKQAASYATADSADPAIHKTGRMCFDYEVYGVYSATPAYPTPAPISSGTAANSVCTTILPASALSDSGTVAKIDTKVGSLTTDVDTYTWNASAPPLVYNADCKLVGVSTLKVGADIDVYYSSTQKLLAIQSYQ